MPTVAPADGATLQRVLQTTPLPSIGGLSRAGMVTYEAAQAKTPWGLQHRRRFALVESGDILASAEQYDLAGRLDGHRHQ